MSFIAFFATFDINFMFLAMFYKVIDLENDSFVVYRGKGFCNFIGISEANFNNRWRARTTLGITVGNRWYIKEFEILE